MKVGWHRELHAQLDIEQLGEFFMVDASRGAKHPGTDAHSLRKREMTEDTPVFDALFNGEPPQQFLTLQDAMFWVEDLDSPTGTIEFQGQAIISYDSGAISVAE